MWDRSIIKSNAKAALRGRYWTAFGVCLLAMVIGGGFSIITMRYQISYRELAMNMEQNLDAIVAQSGLMNLISIGGTLFSIFVALPITLGVARFFVQNRFGRTDFNNLFSGFRINYLGGVGALFVTHLFIGLWSLLLIIPGIIKALEYSMVPFILADNPYMPGSRARELSRSLTNGEKGGIFVLGLSFLGWILLASIPAGLGIPFLLPYMDASFAELYIFLRDRAIQSGQLNPAEFGLVPPAPPAAPASL